jgi:hypothetical protein
VTVTDAASRNFPAPSLPLRLQNSTPTKWPIQGASGAQSRKPELILRLTYGCREAEFGRNSRHRLPEASGSIARLSKHSLP